MSLFRTFLVVGETAAGTATGYAQPVIPGFTAFCVHEVPIDETGKRRWINLGIIQFVEPTRCEPKISCVGGAFGSGREAMIPVNSMVEALVVIEKLHRVAAACC
ncbi:MAG: hypothetical protein JNK59_01155 [Sterolibacteriaceae bacterium]|uniref:hypothetical protein n=1 Tax=Sulfuritalea sp. TaxID=2480090 RepID=UPI001A3AF740|nr:hypothetical protein [Sulfuritalea sp.]MBL8477887.1 hypothetical protein [Sterolibacteriaceae bacterium]MBN8473836.1 hypothetical protein [Sulfuritalea sp.]